MTSSQDSPLQRRAARCNTVQRGAQPKYKHENALQRFRACPVSHAHYEAPPAVQPTVQPAAQDGTIKLWDAASRSERLSFSVPSGTVLECCFAAADRQVALSTSAPGLGSPGHICSGTGPTPATSVPGPGAPLPHLRRDWAHPCPFCTGTGPTPATYVPGLGSPLPQLQHDWDRRCRHLLRDWAGLAPFTSAARVRLSLPHLLRDSADSVGGTGAFAGCR